MSFDEYLSEEMCDPRFRFWWRIYAPRFWIAARVLRIRFRLRSALYRVCLWLVWELGALADHQVQAGEYPLPTLRELWWDWRGLRGELSARLDFEYRVELLSAVGHRPTEIPTIDSGLIDIVRDRYREPKTIPHRTRNGRGVVGRLTR